VTVSSGDTPVPRVTVVDSTLRDGSHAKRHRFTVEDVRAVAVALDGAGVPWVEVSHGDGLGGSSFNYGLSLVDERVLIAAAADVLTTSRLAVLLLPGIGTKDDLVRARDLGAELVRVATHCTEADIAPQHLGLARDLGMTAVGFLMMAHLADPEALAVQARMTRPAPCCPAAPSSGSRPSGPPSRPTSRSASTAT